MTPPGYPWSAIVLYLDKETPGTLEELVFRFGAKRTQRDGSGYLHAAWSDLMPEISLEEREYHRVLRLDMAIHALGEHLVRDDGQVVAEEFRAGCEALRPQVGMFLSWNWQADPDWLEEQYWAILTGCRSQFVIMRLPWRREYVPALAGQRA